MNKNNDVVLGMLAGAALLSAVGLMYAPFAAMMAAMSRPMKVTSFVALLVAHRLMK